MQISKYRLCKMNVEKIQRNYASFKLTNRLHFQSYSLWNGPSSEKLLETVRHI